VIDSPATGEDFEVVLNYETADGKPLRNVNFGISVSMQSGGTPLLNLYSETSGALFREVPGRGEIRCRIPRCPLPPAQYFVDAWCDINKHALDALSRAADLTITGGDFHGSGREQVGHRTVLVDHSWSLAEPGEGDYSRPTRVASG
jgi:hypothetical protein